MLTIEHRIMNLLETRLRQYLVNGSAIYVSSETLNPVLASESITSSGVLVQSYPRSFELEITEAGKCKISEVTLYANLGFDAPEPYISTVDFLPGVPFSISDSGISITILDSYENGMKWLVCASNAAYTIGDVSNKRIYDPNALPSPSISLYATGNDMVYESVDQMDCALDVYLILSISKEMYEFGAQYEILGDLRNFVNKDTNLFDNSICLANNFVYLSDEYFDLSDREDSIFKITMRVNYTHKLTDARLK